MAAAPTGLLPVAVAAGTVTVAGWRDGRMRAAVSGAAILAMAFVLFWASYAAIDPHIVHRRSSLLPMPFLRGLRFLAENDANGPSAYLLGVVYRFRRPAPSLPAPDLPAGPCRGRCSERVTTGTELPAPATGS